MPQWEVPSSEDTDLHAQFRVAWNSIVCLGGGGQWEIRSLWSTPPPCTGSPSFNTKVSYLAA